jgi:catabolite regulation protein CreA
MIVSCDGTVNKKSQSSAQMTCIVSTTGIAFSNKKVSVAKAVVRYARKKIFFTKLAFMRVFDDLKLRFGKESNQQSGEIVINGPPKGSV